MFYRFATIGTVCMTLSLAGCQTLQPVDLATSQPLSVGLAPNDNVKVWMLDGRTFDLRLTAIEADTLVGDKVRIPIKDIARVEKYSFDSKRTSYIAIGIFVVIAGLLVLAAHTPFFVGG